MVAAMGKFNHNATPSTRKNEDISKIYGHFGREVSGMREGALAVQYG
jgi:hypothetical protein